MLVANSFDLWQKDAFFSAAEEVQESADIMESAYRRWVRERRERPSPSPDILDELCRELQTALGTAKWQLEEFERAVRVSYGHRAEDSSAARHSQFISAIESQISRVESALRESFREEGKKPLRWVNLDEQERDDLAAFLTGTSQIAHSARDECIEIITPTKTTVMESQSKRKDASIQSSTSSKRGTYDEIVSVKNECVMSDENYAVELEGKEGFRSRDDIICQVDRTANTRRTWSTPNFGDLKIVIPDEDEQRNNMVPDFEGTPKEKGSKFLFWSRRCGEVSRANRPINLLNKIFTRASASQRQFHNVPRMQYGCSVQVTLALMLTVFLIVPFLLFSN